MVVLYFPWMAGSWYGVDPSPSVKDIDGVVLNVGDTIKVVCTIVSITQTDFQHGIVTLSPNHPFPGQQANIAVDSTSTVFGS